jgi:hypothetical protein
MASRTGFAALGEALKQAQVDTDADLELTESSAMAGAIVPIKQLHASYRSGNEYLRLDTLLCALGDVGTVKVFEYRGRGAGEKPTLVADVDIAGELYQLIYHLE